MAKNSASTDKRLIHNWGTILLDTTVVIRAINYAKNQHSDNKLCYDLFRFLSDNKYSSGTNSVSDRTFLVSAISIAEILEYSNTGVRKSQKINQALNAKNIVICDFDEDCADVLDKDFCDLLNKKNATELLQRWGGIGGKNEREGLTNDLMIIATGISIGANVFICQDKLMYKIGREIGLNMVYMDDKFFNTNGSLFFEYYTAESDKEFNVTPKEDDDISIGIFSYPTE